MLPLSLHEINAAVRGQLTNADGTLSVTAVTTDSRQAAPGALFVALKGERFDGHDFIGGFYAKGGSACVCAGEMGVPNAILVPDTRLALGELARYYRGKFDCPVVAVTGSAGKTSTRQMLEAVLSRAGETLATSGNLNNDIGLPRTIFGLERRHRFAVLELGMNHSGEIRYLTRIARPDIAVITNIGTAHIGNLGSREAILAAKLELLEGLRPGGCSVMNGDDALLWGARDTLGGRRVFYGIENPACEYRAEDVRLFADSSEFTCLGARLRVNAPGRHHVLNALAAIATADTLGLPADAMREGVAAFRAQGMRQAIKEAGGVTIVEDCYNANAESMAAALEVLAGLDVRGRRVAVLGDMLELGSFSQAEHRRVGAEAARQGIDLLLTVGAQAAAIADEAARRGVEAVPCADKAQAIAKLNEVLRPGDAVLVKASRGARFEEIAAAAAAWRPSLRDSPHLLYER